MTDSDLEMVKDLVSDSLKNLMVEGKVVVEKDEETIRVNIETSQSGALIGYHGEGLISLQLILNIMVYKKTGSWQRVVVNVGDYRQKREEYLKNLALNVATRVKTTRTVSTLNDLSSFERRIIHLVLSEDPEIEAYSEGEGKDRHLIIKPKAS
ncbi:KH domain-containing protein [Candidatus Gottesmanbacteria bacterium]|nr:KH domain-containing protein [Candidatus Gottesmanbacteria bacterium]